MAARGLSGRIGALEQLIDPPFKGGVFIVVGEGEDSKSAVARWERANGPLDGRMAITWIKTGVPRTRGSLVCA